MSTCLTLYKIHVLQSFPVGKLYSKVCDVTQNMHRTNMYLSPLRFMNHIPWSLSEVASVHKDVCVQIFIDTLVKLEKHWKSLSVLPLRMIVRPLSSSGV